jgi:hypothetical protein
MLSDSGDGQQEASCQLQEARIGFENVGSTEPDGFF